MNVTITMEIVSKIVATQLVAMNALAELDIWPLDTIALVLIKTYLHNI